MSKLVSFVVAVMASFVFITPVSADVVVTVKALSKGLDRIDQRTTVLDGKYTYSADGTGVRVYMIDSGIWSAHSQFEGRASLGYDVLKANGVTGLGDAEDCYGHGTGTSGTVGGRNYGVAPKVTLISIRVLDCYGNARYITANGVKYRNSISVGLEWVIANAVKPAVVNMSVSSPANPEMDNLVAKLSDMGIPVVVASGNSNANACNYSPSRAPSAITVGSEIYVNDVRYGSSNFGPCVDLYAPGYNVTSAAISTVGDTNAYMSYIGTSFAAPEVTGAVAAYLEYHPNAPVSEVTSYLVGRASPVVHESSGVPSVPNLLLYTGP
jgi:subtilisin family serine protease